MIPIRLIWELRTDGFELKDVTCPGGSTYRAIQSRTTRTEPLRYEAISLEDPVVLHFINCKADEDFVAFLNRFGDLGREINESDGGAPVVRDRSQRKKNRAPESKMLSIPLEKLKTYCSNLWRNIAMTTPMAKTDTIEKVRFLNDMMNADGVTVWPSFINSAGNARFVLRADTLYDFMMLETAAIHEVGAVAMLCEHCRKLVITGPLTGRRAHARYCSDRCRVAAMRARNAAKGD